MTFIQLCKDFLSSLLAIDEDAEREQRSTPTSLLYDYQNLIESQPTNGSNKMKPNHAQGVGIASIMPSSLGTTPSALVESSPPMTTSSKEIYYPASLDGLKRQLTALHERNLALEQEVALLNNEIVSIRDRAKKLGAALFESALS
jgi:hypothetical protein